MASEANPSQILSPGKSVSGHQARARSGRPAGIRTPTIFIVRRTTKPTDS